MDELKRTIFLWTTIICSYFQADCNPHHHPKPCCASVFSTSSQHLFPGEIVRFEKVGVSTPDVNLSFASRSGSILFNRAGTYKIIWHGKAISPYHLPWTLGFSLDGLILFGNVYGHRGCSLVEPFEGSVVLSINAGQILQFVNGSSHLAELVSMTLYLCRFEPD